MNPIYKLKWLNGILIGRELELPFGEIRLGGNTPDIALPLELDAETQLIINEHGIIVSQPVPLWVDGIPWEIETPLPAGHIIDLAGLVFIFGTVDQVLPTLPIPHRKDKNKKKKNFYGVFLLIIILPLSLILIYITTLSIFSEDNAFFDENAWLVEQMKKPEYVGLQASFDDHHIIHLSGISSSSDVIHQLKEQFSYFGYSFYNRSIDINTLHNLVSQILEMNGYHDVEVVRGEKLDTVKIYGDIQLDNQWHQTQLQLKQISQLKSWVVINDRDEEFKKLFQALETESLLEGINILIVGNELLISGQPSNNNESKLNHIVATFNEEKYTRMRVSYQDIPNKNYLAEVLPAEIISIGGNDDYIYLQLSNNLRLYQGSILPSGYRVYAITDNTLMLIKKQRFISIAINL